jgi:hypothetical protein
MLNKSISDICYICYEEESKESPFCKKDICGCKGSIHLHENCFQKLRNQMKCSVCVQEFKNVDHLITNEILELQKIIEWDKHGWKHEFTIDQKGRKQGTYKVYYATGVLWEEIEYKDDMKHGSQKIWNYKGEMCINRNFDQNSFVNEIIL